MSPHKPQQEKQTQHPGCIHKRRADAEGKAHGADSGSPYKDCYKNRKHAVIYSCGKKLQMEQEVQKSQYVVANTIYI